MRALYVNHTSRISGGELSLLALLEGTAGQHRADRRLPRRPTRRPLARPGDRRRSRFVARMAACGCTRPGRPGRCSRWATPRCRCGGQPAAARADLIHANSIRAGIIATGAASASGRPTIVHVRDCLPSGGVSALSLRAIGRADALIANSAYTRSSLGPGTRCGTRGPQRRRPRRGSSRSTSRPPKRALRLGLGESRARPRGDRPDHAVEGPGRRDPDRRGADRCTSLAAAPPRRLAEVRPAMPPATTTPRTSSPCDARSSSSGLTDSVRFLGERDDIPEILRAVDLLLVPSWEEPFGRTVIEAMASGVPVVATDVGGPPEILGEDGCGLVLPPREPRVWAETIEMLLSDPARLTAMGKRGKGGRESPLRHGAARERDPRGLRGRARHARRGPGVRAGRLPRR